MFFEEQINGHQCLERICRILQEHDLYYGHGTDNAWDEACWLLHAVVNPEAGFGQIDMNAMLTAQQRARMSNLLEQRVKNRTPLAYLLRQAFFAGHAFYVDERVLIPRSPIAELIQAGFEPLLTAPPDNILDLCCGSGCIGISCALQFPQARVDLADISGQALEVANMNIAAYRLESRVNTLNSDLFEGIGGNYDLIVCNPPYVSAGEYASLPAEYLKEPEIALVSHGEGLDIPLEILRQAAERLTSKGMLVLEVGNSWQALQDARPDLPFLWLDFEHGGHGVCALTAEQLGQAG